MTLPSMLLLTPLLIDSDTLSNCLYAWRM